MSALSAVLLIFSFQYNLLFFHDGQPGGTARTWFTQYRTSDDAENLWSTFLVRSVRRRGMILDYITVKWKLDNHLTDRRC